MKEQVRLDKYLADMKLGTRSEVKQFIRKGRISVNQDIVKQPERKIDLSSDIVCFDTKQINYVTHEYYMLNKPAGVISASTDRKTETVIDLIVDAKRKDLFPVGRLDKDTEGLLLLTNDGDLAHRLLSPKNHVDKVYYAKVLGKVTEAEVLKFAEGLIIDEELQAMPAKLKIYNTEKVKYKTIEPLLTDVEDIKIRGILTKDTWDEVWVSEIELTIHEGKFHQVKRMFEAVGMKVIYLKRESMGSLKLDTNLQLGEYRLLTEQEIKELRA